MTLDLIAFADVPPHAHGRFVEVTALDRLPDVIEALAKT